MKDLTLTRKQLKENKFIPIRFYLEPKLRDKLHKYQEKENLINIDVALNLVIEQFLGGLKK